MALRQRRGRQKGKYNRQLYSIELEEKINLLVKCLSSHSVR